MTLVEINKELKLHYARIKELKKQKKELIYSNNETFIYLDPHHTNEKEYTKYSTLAHLINSIDKTDDDVELIKKIIPFFIHKDGKSFSKDEALNLLNKVQKYLIHFKGTILDEDAKLHFIIWVFPFIENHGLKAAEIYVHNKKPMKERINIKMSNFLRPNGSMKTWEDKYKE